MIFMRTYSLIYRVLIGIAFLILFNFVFDFYYLSRSAVKIKSKANTECSKVIIKPRLQINDDNFEYTKATKGFKNPNFSYVFENVDSDGYYGNINAGKLTIKEEENILEFTDNPQFNIYVDLL